MEPAEDASLEPAIQWLAQSILASPLIHEQASWVREAGLAEEMEGLKSEVKGVQLVVSAVKGRALGNEPLAESLVELKEVLYDADDAVDELDYWRLLQLDQQDDYAASQADISIESADVPSTCDTLPDPHATAGHGMQPVEISSGTLPNLHETDGHGTLLVETLRGNAATRSSRVGKLRSKLWKEFEILEFNQKGAPVRAKCIHCETKLACPTNQGTGVLQNHLKSKACLNKKCEGSNPLSTADATTNPAPVETDNLSSKKRRRDEELTSLVTANSNRWSKDDFSKMIQDITLKLRHIREGLIPALTILGPDFVASSHHSQSATSHQRRRTSGSLQARVHGRNHVFTNIVQLITKETSAVVHVLAILGVAGVGKTALAQLVYNYPGVKNQFDHLLWIWVSNNFDAMELTKDMLGYVSQETQIGLCNFAKLQQILESHIKSKKVLLILDDVWDGINDHEWNQLLSPFKRSNVTGNTIIVTTRKPCVAKRRGISAHIKLGALRSDDFSLFFEGCMVGDRADHEEIETLRDLGHQIAKKLKGNPLAAETAGKLLSQRVTISHWSSILKNEEWKSLTLTGGIMSSLKLCYDQLPYHLQQCFLYCSLFPCNYEFLGEELVRIWISQGFVKCNNSSKRLEEIGQDYQADLVNLGFFEQFDKKSSSDCTQTFYVMYDLMHDLARVLSRTECATIDGLQYNRMFPTIRHLSIISNSLYQTDDQTGNKARSEKFEEILRNTVTSVGKLRSLVFIGRYDSLFLQFFRTTFQKAHNLRLLYFSVKSADFLSSLCNLINSAHLHYLKLNNGHAEQGALPQVVSKSFHLQVLDVDQNYHSASVALLEENSGEPQVFPSLERLRCLTKMKLSYMQNVIIVFVPSLEELVLFEMPKLKKCSCTSVGGLKSSLRVLEIQNCPALEEFDLFQEVHNYETEHNTWFPNLKKLIIRGCPELRGMIPLRPSATLLKIKGSSFKTLEIEPNSVLGESPCEMTLDDKFLSFHNMRGLGYLEIKDCWNLVSISLRTFGHLTSLKSFKLKNCKEPLASDEDLIPLYDGNLPSLESLSIISCGITGKLLSLILWHSPTLKELDLQDCPQLTQLQIEEDNIIQSNLTSASEASSSGYYSLTSSAADGLCRIPLNLASSLKTINIWRCPRLIFDGSRNGFAGFTSLEKLTIGVCPKLLSSSVHNDGQADGTWLLPQSLQDLSIEEYPDETLRPCFTDNQTHLKKLLVTKSPHLKYAQLEFCWAMEILRFVGCNSVAALRGLRSIVNLKELYVVNAPIFASIDMSGEGSESSQLSGLMNLYISDPSLQLLSFCKGLSSLRVLCFQSLKEQRLTDEQERVLLLHRCLQYLYFVSSPCLLYLPAGLHSLSSLKNLMINDCKGISRLPDLPPSLELLDIVRCSSELSEQCRSLATDRLSVRIDGLFAN